MMVDTCIPKTGLVQTVSRYRDFLLSPSTLITISSGIILLIAFVLDPLSLFSFPSSREYVNILYLGSALVGSSYIWYSAYQGIREHDFTADIPVTIATVAAIGIGQYSAAAIVAVLLLLGSMLEEFVAARANRALDALAALLPDLVTVRREGKECSISLDNIIPGDLILVRSGERIAVDGKVVLGTASVNQATITGESVAVEKKVGDTVFAGTLNELGAIEIVTIHTGSETTLGQIHRLIEEAQEQKPPIERILDRYAKLYTPIAISLGFLLWVWSGDVMRAITMLIVFCPCVMVLATPTALVASIGNAALKGSLVKKGATIETLSRSTVVIFDKTGTLTLGIPHLKQIQGIGKYSDTEILKVAAIAEKFSEHPIGRAIIQNAALKNLDIPDPERFETLTGLGIRAVSKGDEIIIGRRDILANEGIHIPDLADVIFSTLSMDGETVILLAINREVMGILSFEDTIRPESGIAVSRLHEQGIRTVIVTGDSLRAAKMIMDRVGISEVYADILPQDKLRIVKTIQEEGNCVVFVGDGVNDGPALAAADTGIAMGIAGTDVAIETADVALLSDDLTRVPYLIDVSHIALRTIRQNLIFSVGVLIIAVLLTIPGVLTPVSGALLHELSSIPVIANSARLIGFKNFI